MSDAAKYLPLSHREREDESSVSNDWSKHLSACLESIASVAEKLSIEQLTAPTCQPQYRVVDVVALMIWRLDTPRLAQATQLASMAVRNRSGMAGATLAHSRSLAKDSAYASPAVLAARIRTLVTDGRRIGARRSVADLSVAVVAGYDVARSTGTSPDAATATSAPFLVEPIASGAVALARSLSAPVPIRAALRDCTLRASDAGWSVGHGAARDATARDIVLFLWGRADIPRPPL